MSVRLRVAASIRALSEYLDPGKPEPPPPSPELGRWLSSIRDDHATDSDLRILTPAKLGEAMRDAEEGSTEAQYRVFGYVEQDAHVASVYGKRRRAVTAREIQITSAIEDDGSAESKRAQEAADLATEIIHGKWGYGGIGNWREAIHNMTDAIGKGFSLSQIVWAMDNGRWVVSELQNWPQHECILGDPMQFFDRNCDEIRVRSVNHMTRGEALDQWQWVAHVQKTWSTDLAKAALFRALTWPFLFKRFSWRDWTIFCERFGMPLRVGKYSPAMGDSEKAELKKTVRDMGRDSWCTIPEQGMIELIETKSSGSSMLPYPGMIIECNREISKAVLGNPMTTDPGEKGARSLGEVYERGEESQSENDAENLAETIRLQLVKPIVGFNLGWDIPIPRVSIPPESIPDLERDAKIDEALIRMGVDLPRSWFYEHYSRPEPAEGEETVSGGSALPVAPMSDILALAEQKKKSVDWVISTILSREQKNGR